MMSSTNHLVGHSMYAVYAYIGVFLGVNVGIYGIHGVSGICWTHLQVQAHQYLLVDRVK